MNFNALQLFSLLFTLTLSIFTFSLIYDFYSISRELTVSLIVRCVAFKIITLLSEREREVKTMEASPALTLCSQGEAFND